jgi:uncharacterized membrane protein
VLFPRLFPVPTIVEPETTLIETARNSSARRWTVISSGLLACALAVIVLYTSRGAFFSPMALVVAAAVGIAALLLRLRLRQQEQAVHAPVWLNAGGTILALGALIGDFFGLRGQVTLILALTAIICFGISGGMVLRAVRKRALTAK